MNVIKFSVWGEAVPKARPKLVMNRYTGKPHLYTAETTRCWEESVMCQALKHKPIKLIDSEVKLGIKIFRGIPKSMSKKDLCKALSGELRPLKKPDLSNYIKSIEDALNGLFWTDDSIVTEYLPGTGKYYAEAPHVDIEIQY